MLHVLDSKKAITSAKKILNNVRTVLGGSQEVQSIELLWKKFVRNHIWHKMWVFCVKKEV